MLPDLVEVYRSGGRAACEERGLVLHAVGIESQLAWLGDAWVLLVAERERDAALLQLARYAHENPPRRPAPPPESLHAGAWIGSVLYAAVMLLIGYLAGRGALGHDWFDAGVAHAGAIREGEAWRAVTALTLHVDVGHLLANLGFGTVFGFLVGQLLGPGVAWVTVLAAATLANVANALLQPATHSSIGASTAVFATLGLLAAYAWRRRAGEGGRWAYRWAPLIAGIMLLGFTGAGGDRTDVLAHVTGFAMGALAGVAHAAWRAPRGDYTQAVAGLVALGVVSAAWVLALASA